VISYKAMLIKNNTTEIKPKALTATRAFWVNTLIVFIYQVF